MCSPTTAASRRSQAIRINCLSLPVIKALEVGGFMHEGERIAIEVIAMIAD